MHDFIANTQINSWVFNEKTVDVVLETLMEKGIRVNGGQDLGKTVIFAQTKNMLDTFDGTFWQTLSQLPGGLY